MERRIDVHQLERSVVSIVKLIALPIAVLLGIVLYIPALAVKIKIKTLNVVQLILFQQIHLFLLLEFPLLRVF